MLDLLSFHVMNATADDWESLEQIGSQVREACGSVDSPTIAHVIVRLVDAGLLEEMHRPLVEAANMLREPIEYWFHMTARGRLAWESSSIAH